MLESAAAYKIWAAALFCCKVLMFERLLPESALGKVIH